MQPERPSPPSAAMLLLALRRVRGRGWGRPPEGPRCARSPPWSPAWICCWALAACQAAWAGDSPSSGRPLPACQEVSSTWSPAWSLRRGAGWGGRADPGSEWPSPFSGLEDRGVRLCPGMKLLARASWLGAGVQVCCLSGGAFSFRAGVWAFLKGLCSAPVGELISGSGVEGEISGKRGDWGSPALWDLEKYRFIAF